MLAECIDHRFAEYLDSVNQKHYSDEELAPYFDYLYAYDHYHIITDYFEGKSSLEPLVDIINKDAKNNVKRTYFLENHDKRRIFNIVNDFDSIKQLIRLSFMLDGATFIYMGEEYGLTKDVPLFEKDPIDLLVKNEEITKLYNSLLKSKPHNIISQELYYDNGVTIKTVTANEESIEKYSFIPNNNN